VITKLLHRIRVAAAPEPAPYEQLSLRHTPGPSPWYLARPEAHLPSSKGSLTWEVRGGKRGDAGLSVLRDPWGRALLIVDFQCYVRRLPSNRFVVWYESDEPVARLTIQVFDADRLGPIPSPLKAARELRSRKERLLALDGQIALTQIVRAREAGWHAHEFPTDLHVLEEIPLLTHSNFGGRVHNGWDTITQQLWLLYPKRNQFRAAWQDWYNKGAYDFGYQWPTRVARGAGGAIVGEGFRIRPFELDESLANISRWLEVNPFDGSSGAA
jgi:hypothetical protein